MRLTGKHHRPEALGMVSMYGRICWISASNAAEEAGGECSDIAGVRCWQAAKIQPGESTTTTRQITSRRGGKGLAVGDALAAERTGLALRRTRLADLTVPARQQLHCTA
jgi:hypothetical protein